MYKQLSKGKDQKYFFVHFPTDQINFLWLYHLIKVHYQCLKWTVAQSPNATNILFGRPKAALN